MKQLFEVNAADRQSAADGPGNEVAFKTGERVGPDPSSMRDGASFCACVLSALNAARQRWFQMGG